MSKTQIYTKFGMASTQLDDFAAPMVNTYSLETTVAEMLDAILSLMEFSSRMKDYYDLYYLANKFDFDGAILTEALKKTFENRGHHFSTNQFEQILTFGNDAAIQKKWIAFCRKINTKTDSVITVLKTIKDFLAEPYFAVLLADILMPVCHCAHYMYNRSFALWHDHAENARLITPPIFHSLNSQ